MSSGNKLTLLADTAISGSGVTTSDGFVITRRDKNLIAVLEVSSFTDGTYDVDIQQSPDGVTWGLVELAAIPSGIAAGIQYINLPDAHLPQIRAVVTATGVTTGATVNVSLYSEHRN